MAAYSQIHVNDSCLIQSLYSKLVSYK